MKRDKLRTEEVDVIRLVKEMYEKEIFTKQ